MSPSSARRTFWTTVIVLAVFNIVRGLGAFGDLADAATFALSFAVAAVALWRTMTPSDLGLDRTTWRSGVRWGAVAFAVVLAVVVLAAVIPEELLFRGVLLGAALGVWGSRRGLVAASVVFGLWHVFPTLSTAGGNEAFAGADATVLGHLGLVVGAVVSTAVAGAIFGWLRLRSRSLLAPVLAHLSTNGVALVVAWFVVHRPGR